MVDIETDVVVRIRPAGLWDSLVLQGEYFRWVSWVDPFECWLIQAVQTSALIQNMGASVPKAFLEFL